MRAATISIGASDATGVLQPAIFAPADVVVGEGGRLRRSGRQAGGARPEHGLGRLHDGERHCGRRQQLLRDYVVAAGEAHLRARRDDQGRARADSSTVPASRSSRAFTLAAQLGQVNSTIARASARISIVDNDTVVATPRLLRARRRRRREGRGRARLGAPRRPDRPGLDEHGHRQLRDR